MGWTGLGVIGRDHRGEVVFSAVKRVQVNWSPLVAEAQGMLFGLIIAKEHGWLHICCETDCLQLVSLLKAQASLDFRVGNTIADILDIASDMESVEWNHVRRDFNEVAHTLAALESDNGTTVWKDVAPLEVQGFVDSEKTSHAAPMAPWRVQL